MILLFVEHKGHDGMTLIGMDSSLSMNMDSSTANAKVVGGTRNSMERRRYCGLVIDVGNNQRG